MSSLAPVRVRCLRCRTPSLSLSFGLCPRCVANDAAGHRAGVVVALALFLFLAGQFLAALSKGSP